MIEMRHVSFAYKTPQGAYTVLRDFSLKAEDGARLCLFGASGVGKTTVLRLLLGLETPDAGTISGIEGRKKAAVFQEDRLLPFATIFENLTLFGSREDALRHLSALGIAECADVFPSALSGGMKRRAAIARALTANGDALFLDEPFNGLDDEARRTAASHILASSEGKTVFLVSHDKTDAALLCAQIVTL